MSTHYTPKGKHLTIAERRLIEKWKDEGKPNRQIALLLGKGPQTIHNDIKRELVRQQVRKGKFELLYSADAAQSRYESARKKSVRKGRLDKAIKEKILHYIKQKYSPEMMVNAKKVNVPISTIYYWIHHGQLGLTYKDLIYPRKPKAEKKRASPRFKPVGKSIEGRPEIINQRLENGHYEIDTVILTKQKNQCLLTLTDRRSRHQIIRLIPDKTAQLVNQVVAALMETNTIKFITADNGTEFNRLAEIFPQDNIYYAYPYSSRERGTNENHNRLIRRWLPKGVKKITHKQVTFIENWINNYPKKVLNYKSPQIFLMTG